jgi:hypothetical protein
VKRGRLFSPLVLKRCSGSGTKGEDKMVHVGKVLASTLLATTILGASGAYAQSLGGLLGGDSSGGLIGGSGSGATATLTSGEADDSGTVNVGLGGDSNIADINLGSGSDNIGDVTASTGGQNGLADVDAALGEDVNGRAGVTPDRSLATVDLGDSGGALLDIGGDGGAVDLGLNLDPGSLGGAGGAGGAGAGGAGTGLASIGGGGGGGAAGLGADCRGFSASQASALIKSGDYSPGAMSSWSRASGVELTRVPMCQQLKVQVSAALSRSGLAGQIQQAAARDSLVSASLGRTNYGADDVMAIRQSGSKLIVYVY